VIREKIFHEHCDAEHCAMLAVYHDAGEVFTGDMPTPVKYFTEDLHDKYKEIEDKARRRLLETLPDELKDTYRFMKNFFTDHCKSVGNHDGLQGMLRVIFRKGIPHKSPALYIFHSCEVRKKSVHY